MNKTDCFYLGKITKPFSYKGELVVFLDVDQPLEYAKLDAVYIEIGNQLVLYAIDAIRINNNKAVVRFADTTVEHSEQLIGKELYLPLTSLPPLEGNKFYYHEIIGFNVEDKVFGTLGPVTQVIDNSRQALFSVDHSGREVLIPIVDDFIIDIDRQQKKILVNCPEGLIDIYLERD